ncbi:TonB-dependent siderophore receptor [Shewanella sp. NIFS-20-20]|uniref:TonB-dependent receptor n=1 Tax=Shewanella sp. NIFS-20-20 TaxID=2853806 RepID=UPI001C484C1F|nr:TonB-dependent receptor [Shewanella sp. NIFS-20-20]MBV7317510.1 TonB-dependent receptor [Shewanella sp. NIFS-20-20]
MYIKRSSVSLAIMSLLSANVLADDASHSLVASANIERISVVAQQFNQYKTGSASGAMRGDIALIDTPQSVTVIPDFVTDEQLATNLGEVLSNDSSVTAGSEKWNRQVFAIRGFELSSGSGFLVNGHQHWSHYVQPIETLQQVEVLKGPSSMLYGQSGPGGLVNMVTKKPTYDNVFNLGFDSDDLGSTRFQLDAGGAVNDEQTVRYRTVLVKQDTKYWREYFNGDQQERDRILGFVAVDFDLTDDISLSLRYDHTADKTNIDSGAWLDSQGKIIGDRKDIWEMPWTFTDNTVTNIGADVQWLLSDAWTLKTGYNHQRFERQRLGSSPTYTENPFETGYKIKPFDRHDDWQHKTAYVDFVGNLTTGSIDHQLLIGGNYLNYFYQQFYDAADSMTVKPGEVAAPEVNYLNATAPRSTSEYHHYGFYVQDLMSLTDQWKLLAGVRYDEQKKDGLGGNSYAVSPKFGVVYAPTDTGSIYVNYSKSFSPQGMVNDEFDVNDQLNLKPEYGTQYELGTKWEFNDGGIMLTAAVFDINVENKTVKQILLQPTPAGDLHITTQDGQQHHQGFEVGAQGQVSDRWFITSSMMYLDAKYQTGVGDSAHLDGKTPIDAPEWSANIWSRYEVNDDFALNLGAVYVGERFANTSNTIVKNGYVRFDIGAAYGWDLQGTEVNLRMNIKNLLNKDYLDGGSYQDVSVGEGRSIALAVEAKF